MLQLPVRPTSCFAETANHRSYILKVCCVLQTITFYCFYLLLRNDRLTEAEIRFIGPPLQKSCMAAVSLLLTKGLANRNFRLPTEIYNFNEQIV